MERLNALVCLGFICVASIQAAIDPRGARPVEHGTRSEKCASQREWPFCTTDEWGSKCPSGCRIQGLMDKYDHNMLKRIEKIRNLLDQYKAKHRSADTVSKQTYDYLKDKLTIESGGDNSYYDLAQNLRQRITDLKIKIDRQLRILAALKDRVKDQVVEMQRLEVDIDIKLRSCKGSCSTYTEYQVDQESYVTLEKQVSQLDSHSPQRIESVGTLYVMKSRPLKEAIVDSIYKSSHGSVAAQKREDVFPEVETVQLILEQEGSVTSPATISKDPGTSYSAATSSTSSSTFGGSSSSSSSTSSSTSSKSITELGGRGDGDLFSGGFDAFGQPSTHHVSSKTLTCTKSTRRVIVHTKEGPVERTEEVMEGGPECQAMADNSRGGMSSLFPSLGHASSSSSTSSSSSSTLTSKTVHTGGTKGSITGVSKGGFGDPFGTGFGFDLGPFHTAAAEDDIPDFHARSVKSTRFERQADYVGKDCVEAHQNHLKGETNGLFKIKPGGTDSKRVVEVYCQQEGLMGGWLLVQQRESGALSFNRTWAEYRNGFGSVNAQGKGDFWLGNQNLHLLTNQSDIMLKVELEDWEGGVASAEYTIRVGSEEEGYALHVSGYIGDAGDALVMPKSDMASFLSHNGMKFSTFDKDNDKWEENCAEMYGGGWWYNNCQSANLNGIYYKGSYDPEKNTPYEIENGVVWVTFKPANYSLKTVRMFIRPNTF
ncbi:fibrinogen alpha chain isoform X2 [Seriola lalandi dorsalis]|uniref:Fibrinogen alpha chain n=1 Tax=Seriola lalandi dorsalis TaxID=1841481 RepID=A0A3B4Y5C1_SERLL|nr:fibrinogen alpha chain isoform X2 [Seriola lalandi dorsalis]